MSPMKQAKQDYEKINIPHDLDACVDEAIEIGRRRKRLSMNKGIAVTFSAAAGFIILLNASTVFAANMQSLPFVGDFFRVLTFRHIEEDEDRAYINAEIPAITSTGNEVMEQTINDEVYSIITDKIEACKERAEADWIAYLNTGGNPEDSEERQASFYADYNVYYDQNSVISFVVHMEESNFFIERLNYYYNLDVTTGKTLSLEELLGENYIDLVNEEVLRQIDIRNLEAGEEIYFTEDFWTFKTISEDQNFYINADGQVVIVFERYEITPGYLGEQEFIMPFAVQLPQHE